MSLYDLQPGDTVYAATAIQNDGGIPHLAGDALLAEPGARGVVVNIGYAEADPDTLLISGPFREPRRRTRPAGGLFGRRIEHA
jgi:nitrogen fixation protein NifZ